MKNVFAKELQEWLSEMDRGRGVMLRYEEAGELQGNRSFEFSVKFPQALLQYSGWEELLERGADKSSLGVQRIHSRSQKDLKGLRFLVVSWCFHQMLHENFTCHSGHSSPISQV